MHDINWTHWLLWFFMIAYFVRVGNTYDLRHRWKCPYPKCKFTIPREMENMPDTLQMVLSVHMKTHPEIIVSP